MAGRSLKPATDRCLGKPLPYQLANPTQAHLIVKAFKKRPSFPRRAYAVLAWFSPGCPPLLGRYLRVTHPSATRQPEQALLLPFDVHVLSIPPAFNLSQDQTLQLKFLIASLGLAKSLLELRSAELTSFECSSILAIAKSNRAPTQVI